MRADRRQLVDHIPRQQFVDAGDDVISDVGQDVFQIGARVDAIEFARSNQAVHRGSPLAPAVGTSEQEVLSP